MKKAAPKGTAFLQSSEAFSKCFESRRSLTKVTGHLIDANFDMRNVVTIQRLLQVRIFHFLRIAELHHEDNDAFSTAFLHKAADMFISRIFLVGRIVEENIVACLENWTASACRPLSRSSGASTAKLRLS